MKKFIYSAAFSAALLTAAVPSVSHACTSWMVFSDMTKNNTNILHKNRDSKIRNISVILSPADSPRKWVALGNDIYTAMGINSSGLAGAVNSGERCIDPPKVKGKKDTTEMLRAALENCDTAVQAVDKIKELMAAGDYSHGDKGSIFTFVDRNEGYVCEITAKFASVQRYDKGYTVRANIWQNPNMYQMSRNTLKGHLDSSIRAFVVISELNKVLDSKGKITSSDNFAVSRQCLLPDDIAMKRSVCYTNTNSAADLEVDRRYPDILSTMYAAVGHPRHTIYLPIPVCTQQILPDMQNINWSKASYTRLKELKYNAPIPSEWSKFEADSTAEYKKAQAEARKLLDAGKRTDAVKLLNSTAEKIWKNAEKLLKI